MSKHLKMLLGGSPCTYWSISQSSDKRETTASGIGWELFKNFLIAKEKFKPDYFLYENNKSMAKPIRNQIDIEFNHTYAENTNWELISSVEEDKGHINRMGDYDEIDTCPLRTETEIADKAKEEV